MADDFGPDFQKALADPDVPFPPDPDEGESEDDS